MKKRNEYYEFPNGEIARYSDAVYIYDFNKKEWNLDHSLTATFAWDMPYGDPCHDLRKKIDISDVLPPFPSVAEFIPGNFIFFGAYPQKSTYDYSPIEWIVLDTDGTIALCISKYCLITSTYCDPQEAYGKPELLWWKNSLVREVCNVHFYDTAFSETEKALIIPREITAVQFGEKCIDNVFLLSEQEVCHYFPKPNQRMAKPTPYSLQKGARRGWTEETSDYTSWWLLPEENAYDLQDSSIYPKAVFQMGEIQFHSRNIYHGDFTIRPCIQVKYK